MTESVAGYIRSNNHHIVDLWEEEVNREVEASGGTHSLVLRNLLPNLLEDIALVLSRYRSREDFLRNEPCKEIIQKSVDHGRHRATSSQYTAKQMIREYIILNRVLVDNLISEDLFNTDISIILTFTLETSMSHSIDSFSESIQEMREKLVGTLAHDIRNPISTTFFSLDLLQYQTDREQFDQIKKKAKESLRRSLDLLEGLLDAISVKAGEGITLNFEETNIVKDVRRVHEEASQIYSNKIALDCEAEEIEGVFDPSAVRRVLENLITNAVKYGARDQTISISVEHTEEKVILKVHNHGHPITSKNQKIIFEFLSHSEEQPPGELKSWGMGLTFVKMAADAHAGHVELTSNEETGTTFCVVLDRHSNKPGKVKSRVNYQSRRGD